jgi:hypothetical protein
MSDENKVSNYYADGFSLLYQNEGEDLVRQFSVDFQDLNKQAKDEDISKEKYHSILYGFQGAMRVVFGNYDLYPKQTAVDAMQRSVEFHEKILEKISEMEKQQDQELKEHDNERKSV